MATYPGMSLGGEVRESISLDEDDLSDVEDEVFIRDGKNSYKLAEELNVKRPLMAPRRKPGKSDLTSRLKVRPPCKAFCKPCCYIFAALSILIGDNYNVLPPDIFCPIFLGVPPPCQGGVIALNGTTGDIVWRYWINDTIFALQCSADLNGDGLEDCLATGDEGSLVALDSRNGSQIWLQNNSKMDVFVANFIPDQNNDSIADILSSHTSLVGRYLALDIKTINLCGIQGKEGHLILISGKTGKEIKRIKTPYGAKTFFMPQLLQVNNSQILTIFGTGSPTSPGNLSIVSIENLIHGNLSARTIYEDHYKGVLTQSVLVDITGDNIPDIVTAMYNSTVVAINGFTFGQIWNYTIPNSESNITPTPAYFNDDNVTDFLIIYEKYDNILNYNYTKTFIIDGKTGKPIYTKPISGSVTTQMNGLTLGMESHGFDMYLFWTTECTNVEIYEKNKVFVKETNYDSVSDVCRQNFNTTSIMKLNALNQYDQPPGFEIYNSVNRTALEFNNTKSPIKQIREYFIKHPKIQMVNNQGQSEIDENYMDDSQKIRVHKYGSSSFRHKDNRQGIVKDYMNDNDNNNNPEINEG
ncbi:PQQ 2 and/or VCBS domain containing protein, partial [Asbolus verrucosus]